MTIAQIDWHSLLSALTFYQARGYQYRELPWIAPMDVILATTTADTVISVNGGGLVGSAEQAFVAARNDGTPVGKFVALGPCFRNEPVYDAIHRKTFMKVELHRNDVTTDAALYELTDDASSYFSSVLIDPTTLTVRQNHDGVDLEVNGIEVGSYGRRSYQGYTWLYGTGLAQPRLTVAST